VDYSLIIMVAIGMMKMASGDDLPLRQGAETGVKIGFSWLQRLAAAELLI
jgi:hypothetical protein